MTQRPGFRPAGALRQAFAAGYSATRFRQDVLAGLVVGVVALPLSMALAIACGVAPQHGLYTAIVAGFLIASLGGSPVQVSGPTAAFVVVLAPIVHQHGLGGLMVATVMAGVLLMLMGIGRMGQLVAFVPYPVTTGFTSGIAVVLATLQVPDLLGLDMGVPPDHYLERVGAIARALPTAHLADAAVAALTMATLLGWPRLRTPVPAPLVGLAIAALVGWLLQGQGIDVATVGSRFGEIPRTPPLPVVPWHMPDAEGAPTVLTFALIRELAPSACVIAMLGALESLLSAVVADGMAGTRHDPDGELFAQGVGNFVAPFLGGFAATGAIARTATNIRAGAQSPIAAMTHSVALLVVVVAAAPLLATIPMAALASLLVLVAFNMSEARHFAHMVRVAPKSDTFVLIACFALTVVFDMAVAVGVGMVLASFLFMRRMAELSGARIAEEHDPITREPLPPGVIRYEVRGPLFFGAAQKAMSSLGAIAGKVRVVILDLTAVPAMDATGLVNLESAMLRLERDGVRVLFVGVQPQPEQLLRQAGLWESGGGAVRDVTAAVGVARMLMDRKELEITPP